MQIVSCIHIIMYAMEYIMKSNHVTATLYNNYKYTDVFVSRSLILNSYWVFS